MKKRIRELVAFILMVCVMLGSVGIESRASYRGSPTNSANINTEQGWLNYTNLWTYQNHTYTHYGWYGYFQSLSGDGNQIYSINDKIPVDSDGNKLVPSSNTENEFISIWTSNEVYGIAATDSDVDYIVGSTPTTGSSNQYIDVPAGSSVQVKGDLYKAVGFRDGVTGDSFPIDMLSKSRPDGVAQITAENGAEVCIGTYDLQPVIRKYVVASYDLGTGHGIVIDAEEFTADENEILTLSNLTAGKNIAPDGYMLDHWEYYYNGSKIDDTTINLNSITNPDSGSISIVCKAFWKPAYGYDIRFQNNSGMDISLKINENSTETSTQVIKASDTSPLYRVSSLSGWSTNGLYQITSWYGYGGNSASFTSNNAVLNLTSPTDKNIQAVLNAVSYNEDSHLPIMNGYISPGSDALQRALTLSFDSNAGGESGQIVNITGTGLNLSDYLPESGLNEREGLTLDRWTYFLTDSNTDREDQEIEGGMLTLDDVSDYKTVRITPIYKGTVTFVDESNPEGFNPFDPMEGEEGTPIELYDLSELRDGYTFVGWSETKGSTTAEYAPRSPYTIVKDTILYAVWKINTYNLTLQDYSDDTTAYTPKEYSSKDWEYGSTIHLPSDLVKEGYTFSGWSDGKNTYRPGDTFSMPADNVNMYAYWQINSYKLNYDGNGTSTGVPTESEEIVYKNTATVSSMAPVRTGYTFSGWSDGTNTYQPGATFSMPAHNVTLTAQWKPNRHNVTYDGDGATSDVPDSHEADYDSSVTAGSGPKKDGYVFSGWEQISTGKTISAGGAFLMPDMDETLKAKWQIAYSKMGKGTFYLVKGQNYSMGGTLKVSGDTSVYSSGITFYVPSSGNYTFE